MNLADYLVLFASIGAIALYGILRTRGKKNLHDYLRGQKKQSWFLIGLSVMATQASAITFLSTPGQGYDGGLSFVQNYFAVPLALIIISIFFLPLYRKLNVYTAYEFLGTRFDKKTRLLAAALFLLQRGLGAGYTLYAPAIVLSTVFGWSLQLTILLSGIVVIAYTVVGGSDAVTHTQKYQLAIIFAGMIAAFVILLHNIPCSFTDSLALAGHFGKLNAVSFSLNPDKRYTFWTGMLGGLFLMLSYFGADQSQVQRYISGDNLRESRLGLMFNALLKIPMQFGILLLGVLLFVFYLFHPVPMFFNKNAMEAHFNSTRMLPHDAFRPDWDQSFDTHSEGELLREQKAYFENEHQNLSEALNAWRLGRQQGNANVQHESLKKADASLMNEQDFRMNDAIILRAADGHESANDNDYVFITFILDNLPHGLIGLLVAAFFCAALSSKAAELNALASTTTVDLYLHLFPTVQNRAATVRERLPSMPEQPDRSLTVAAPMTPPAPSSRPPTQDSELSTQDSRPSVRAAKLFTILWGIIALLFALFLLPHFGENLIQATNIVGSLFYGVILGLFLIAFFFKFITGTPAFLAAVVAQALVITLFATLNISYLWYNLLGCLACITLAIVLQPLFPPRQQPPGFDVLPPSPLK
ncbi:MAG TPA: sodium:solute symporter [Phycisphaerae bacterium]|nr:sodium:solute symporter [Phycisphaerae bacterium]